MKLEKLRFFNDTWVAFFRHIELSILPTDRRFMPLKDEDAIALFYGIF